jgi:hypothetical protein
VTINISDGICAYVAGGLGNQLFILAAAWEQAKRLDSRLYLDTSFQHVSATRPSELNGLDYPGSLLGRESPWRSVRLSKNRVIPVPRVARPLNRKIYFEKNSDQFDPSVNSIALGTTMFGYFQSEMYFPSITSALREMIFNAPEKPEETDFLQKIASERRVTLHLRRGDYLDAPINRQLVASTGYALRARDILHKLGESHPIRVFSDSPILVREELRDVAGDFEFVEDGGMLSPINTIKAMAGGESIIMSNSSFSWWAAWLMQNSNSAGASLVVAPRPWNESGTAKADLLRRDWISLDAR